MTIKDIVSLANAGFTAEQIAALAAAPQPAEQPQPAAQPQPIAQPQPADDPISKLMAQVGALTAAVQASNIGTSRQPQPQTADDILAEIIAPPSLNKKGES